MWFRKRGPYLAETFRLCVLLEAKCREVNTVPENKSLGQNTDTTDTVDFHFHIWIAVRVAEVGKMRAPRGVLGVAFDNDRVFVQGVGQSQGCLGFLPRVQIVRLLATEPVREGSPNIYRS